MSNPQNIEGIDEALVKEVESNISKVDTASVTAMVQCTSALHWGGNWSLISNQDENYAEIAKLLPEYMQKYRNKVHIARIRGGIVLQADTNYLMGVLTTLAPRYASANSADFLQRVQKTQSTEFDRFKKYWKSTLEGKTGFFNAKDDKGNPRQSGTLGVFCTNTTQTITVNGIVYPAYKLSPQEVWQGIAAVTPKEQFNRIQIAVHDPKGGSSKWVPLASAQSMMTSALSFPYDTQNNVINRPNALLIRLIVK